MEQIVIIRPDGTLLPLTSRGETSGVTKAEQIVSLLGEDIVNIIVKAAAPIEFYIGDKIDVYGKTYTLNQLPIIKKVGARNFEYTLTFEGVQYELIDVQWLLPNDTILDSFTSDLEGFINILIDNANRVFPGTWAKGITPTDTEIKTLTYTESNCLEVLQKVCEEYETEFDITQSNGIRTINIKKAGVTFPYKFKYGRTGGLYELTRQNINAKNVVTRLYVYGGSNNLGSKYRYSKLCLPGLSKNSSFIENSAAVEAFGIKENTKTFDKVYPNRVGEVTALGGDVNSFIDSTMNFDLNELEADGITTKWLINGVKPKIKFTTGGLAGYELECSYKHDTKTIRVDTFTDSNGMKFPSETSAAFQFKVGDKYIFTDINLPDAYKADAETKLQTEGEAYYLQYCQPQVQYGLSIDQNFIKQFAGELTIVNLFGVGDYIDVEDQDIGLAKLIRITAFTRDLLQPYKYAITIGDKTTQNITTRVISGLQKIDEVIKINNLTDPAKARRNWRASQEVLAMVFDPEGDYYSEKIKPLSIETTMLQVGAKSMQFVLRNVVFEPNYQSNPNYIRISGGQLIHYTIEEAIRSWEIAQVTFSNLVSNTAYYIYARCSIATGAGTIILDTTQRKVDYEVGFYTFMIGVLNSVETDTGGKNPARLVSLTYGSSTINGRFIRTGRIESSDGSAFLDLDGNTFELGNNNVGLSWNKNKDSKLRLRGTLIQSPAGVESEIGVFRGDYIGSVLYYSGDEVTYNGSTFRCIKDLAAPGVIPTNTTYWKVIAKKGDIGLDGAALIYRGDYLSSKTYYGNETRLDVVRYNNIYYKAIRTAGTFTNKVPTNSTYWEEFGAQFESIATNLLLAEGANIGDWSMEGGKIVSTLGAGNKITLDANNSEIKVESNRSGGDYSEDTNQGSNITVNANSGIVEARSKTQTSRVAYLSPTGIFANNAETLAVGATMGINRKASIVGLGYGNVGKSNWQNENFIAGVYGAASNSGTAPAYGGFFQNLLAAGFFLKTRAIEEGGPVYLHESDSMVIGYSRNQQTVYLPADGVIGRVIFMKQWWTGSMIVYPRGGQNLYDDSSVNSYMDIREGQMGVFVFTIGYIAGVKKEAWLASKFKF